MCRYVYRLVFLFVVFGSQTVDGQLVVDMLPESSLTYPAGTNFDGFVADSADPLAPFSGESVHFQGWLAPGAGSGTLGDAFLVYRARLDFGEEVILNSISVTGAGDHTGDSTFRLLDEHMNPITSVPLTGFNTLGTHTIHAGGIGGSVFHIDEYDRSTTYRYRTAIDVEYTAAPGGIVGNPGLDGAVPPGLGGPFPPGLGHSPPGRPNATGLLVEQYSSSPVSGLADADAVIASGGPSVSGLFPVINFTDDPNIVGRFAGDEPWPASGNFNPGDPLNTNFVTHVTGWVNVPTAGEWTFGTANDDGVRLRVDGVDVIVDDSFHPVFDFYGTVNLEAGLHEIDLVFFEGGGEAVLELFAAEGNFSAFDSAFALVGDVTSGGLATFAPDGLPPGLQAGGILPPGWSPEGKGVPEPSSVHLLLLGCCYVFRRTTGGGSNMRPI